MENLFCIHVYRIGPLVWYWTMCFEAKPQYLKSLATCMGNYVCYSLALRHQSYMYYILSSESGFCNDNQSIGKGTFCDLITCALYMC